MKTRRDIGWSPRAIQKTQTVACLLTTIPTNKRSWLFITHSFLTTFIRLARRIQLPNLWKVLSSVFAFCNCRISIADTVPTAEVMYRDWNGEIVTNSKLSWPVSADCSHVDLQRLSITTARHGRSPLRAKKEGLVRNQAPRMFWVQVPDLRLILLGRMQMQTVWQQGGKENIWIQGSGGV
jgi:hypothetical protein